MPNKATSKDDSVTLQRTRLAAVLEHVPQVRDAFTNFLIEQDIPQAEISGWKLTFTELANNAIVHGARSNPEAEIIIDWWGAENSVHLSIQDPGIGPEKPVNLENALPEDLMQEHGRGRFLVLSFVDSLQEWQGRHNGYRVEVSKQCPGSVFLDPPSEEMESILSELSASYEGLAAFYQLSESLVKSNSLSCFLSQSLPNVRDSIDLDYLCLILDSNVPEFVTKELGGIKNVILGKAVTSEMTELLTLKTEQIWEDHAQRRVLEVDFAPFSHFSSGCLLPITAESKFLGILAAGRMSGAKRIASSQVNNLRTFADIFGISIANYISTTIRREAEKDLREFEIAAEIQQHLLPVRQPSIPLQREVRIFQRVAQNVAGDFAEYCQDRLGNHYVTIIDVMGKGVSAALLGIIYRAAFNLLLDDPKPLPVMLQRIGRILTQMLGELTMFITVTILRWNDETNVIEQVNAGHCPTIKLAASGEITEYEPSGPPIGLMESFTYHCDVIVMEPGDRLALVSDGCYEWRCPDDMFGWERLVEMIRDGNYSNGAIMWHALCKLMDEKCPSETPSDDITLVFIK
ncbi:SpoIIE family protein phosphatase [Cerasicoccus maritimus]|uniref:SpoIIE family protein phosphatase n=1 Tax=Cerasicoccus maritimus TaxID=490089 RepID=UPI0028528C7B|nr:SpoIIE family protein phosphatase [Cerasicoccus maritimus]